MTNPAIIEAAARVLFERDMPGSWDHIEDYKHWTAEDERDEYRETAAAVLAAVTPLIEAAALERAAKSFEDEEELDADSAWLSRREIAASLRALKP